MPAEISIEGADRLGALSKRLKAADKVLQTSMRARMRTAVKPVVEEVKTVAGEHSKTIPGSVVAEFRYAAKTAGVRITAKRSRMPKGKEPLPGLMEKGNKGGIIRHPVFGNRQVWVNQPIHPFLAKTVEANAEHIRGQLLKIIDDVERELGA